MEQKKRLRNMNWEDYGISQNRYKELKAFCLQYGEKRSKIRYGLTAVTYSSIPHGNNIGKPTERMAIENVLYENDCKIMEAAAELSNPEIAKHILKSVAEGIPYELIEFDGKLGRITVGKTEFNAYRRLFYFYLDRLKNGFKLSEVS